MIESADIIDSCEGRKPEKHDFRCRRKEELPAGKSSFIKADEMWNDYVQAGFSYFKMTGRGNSHPAKENCDSYCYMVKPFARKMMYSKLMSLF